MAQEPRLARPAVLPAAIALACLVAAVFFPVLGFEFVDYDVNAQVVDNPHIRGLTWENLKHIFTSRWVNSYYPVRTLSLALDYRLWGLSGGGFKLTSGLIHLANVLLLFWLALRLLGRPAAAVQLPQPRYDVFSAAFSAGIFAVHPLVVEPVAWVAGREELLMTLGALGCLHFHLTARRLDELGGRFPRALACYAGAAFCCAAACLSNAVAAVIPLLITAWDVLTLAEPKFWKILRGTAALWVMGAATIVIKTFGYKGALLDGPDFFSAKRLMLVLNVYWVNLKSLGWPTDLAPARSQLEPGSFLDPAVILGGLAAGLTCLLLWRLRRRKLVLFGLCWFGLALFQLAVVLATCNDSRLRNPREAVRLAERACQSMDSPNPAGLIILATVYAEAWAFDKAIATTETAIQLAEKSGQTQYVDELRRRLELYRKRVPPESLRY